MINIIILLFVVIIIVLFNYSSKEALTNNNINNIVLIGDSILNNSAYVLSGHSVPDLISKDLEKTPEKVLYNFAKDGATIGDCYSQLDKISSDLNNSNTDIFISVGGNNILKNVIIDNVSTANLFDQYIDLIKTFKKRVPNAHLFVLNLYYPLNINYKKYYETCNKWNKLLEDNVFQGYKIIQTNKLLVTKEDLTNNIEPSFSGGKKIVKAIMGAY
jgi:hypothetical protein